MSNIDVRLPCIMQKRREVTILHKTELIKQMARQAGVSQAVARRSLNAALATIEESLAAGERIILPGFGTFYTRRWPGGRVLDFPTGAWKQLGPRPTTAFRAGAVTKRVVHARDEKRGRSRGTRRQMRTTGSGPTTRDRRP